MANEQSNSETAYSQNENAENKKRRSLILLLLLLLAFGGTLAWMFFDRTDKAAKYSELSQRTSAVQKNYDSIQISYNSVISKMDSMVSENYTLQKLVYDKRAEVKLLNDRLQQLRITFQNDQSASQMEMEALADKINSLALDLQNAKTQRDSLMQLAGKTAFVFDTIYLRDTITVFKPLESLPTKAESMLSVKKLTATPSVFNNKSQASAIDLEMVLQKDNSTSVRPEQLFLVVKNEALKVLTTNAANNSSFKKGTVPEQYSGVIYTRADTVKLSTVTYRFTPKDPMTAGKYSIELYHDGKKIGEQKATIRSTVRPYPF